MIVKEEYSIFKMIKCNFINIHVFVQPHGQLFAHKITIWYPFIILHVNWDLRNEERNVSRDGQLRTSLYDKRDDFNFHITNFPFLSSNIPSSPAYGVFISQLIRYARACSSYECLF